MALRLQDIIVRLESNKIFAKTSKKDFKRRVSQIQIYILIINYFQMSKMSISIVKNVAYAIVIYFNLKWFVIRNCKYW